MPDANVGTSRGRGAGGDLRILHLITDLGKGGAERFLLDLTAGLASRAGITTAIAPLYPNDAYQAASGPAPILPLDYEPFSLSGQAHSDAYTRLLDEFRPHVVHTHRWLAEFLSSLDVRQDVSYVCHAHDNMVQLQPFAPRMLFKKRSFTDWLERRWMIRRKYRRVHTTFVANSRHTLEYLSRVLPASPKLHLELVPCGVDVARFSPPAHASPGAPPGAPSGSFPDGRVRIVNIGSFQPKKNQALFVPIALELRKAGVDFAIHLLGDGVLRSQVEEDVRQHGLQDHFHFHGNVHRVEEWLWRSDLYVHTARYEPFGLVLLEAMAAGLPCVVLDGKGNRDIIEDGHTGFLLEEPNPQAFAERIHHLANSPETYKTISRNGRALALSYDMDRVVHRFVELYRRLADR